MNLKQLVQDYLNEGSNHFLVRSLGIVRGVETYQVAVFGDRKEPDNVYHVTHRISGNVWWNEDSPATRHSSWTPEKDKHIRLVKYWVDHCHSKPGVILHLDSENNVHDYEMNLG